MLIANHDGGRIEARFAEKGGKYVCPDCHATLILKKGRVRVPHFSHETNTDCKWGQGESWQHMSAKIAFYDEFRRRKYRAELESVVSSYPDDRRADVMVWNPRTDSRYAIEIQNSNIDPDDLAHRTRAYANAGVRVIWVPVLQDKYEKQIMSSGYKILRGYEIWKFTARPFEKWIHGFYSGEMLIYAPLQGALYKAQLEDIERKSAGSVWFDDEYGHEQIADGVSSHYKRWVKLRLWGPYDLRQIRIAPFRREAESAENRSFPQGVFGRVVVG